METCQGATRRTWQIGRAVASWSSRAPTTFVTGHGPRIYKSSTTWSTCGDCKAHIGSLRVTRHRASNSSWTVTWSILLVTVNSWTTASVSLRRMTGARRPVTVTPQQRALARFRVTPWTLSREVSRIQGCVHRQQTSSDVGSGTGTRVYRQ